jgi:phosphoenolpyruvate---glycerone phosphotransferase subunit DhaM
MTSEAASAARVSLVLVSHSAAVAEGLAELVAEITGPRVHIIAVGGAADGTLGCDSVRVGDVLRGTTAAAGDDAVVVMDFGSAVLTVRDAVAGLDPAQRDRVIPVDAPLVEGAVAAGMAAARGLSKEDVAHAAVEARHVPKL